MKRALLVAPYFTPSNLAGVIRPRLLATHLRQFDWEATVVSVDPKHYEQPNDDASLALLPDRLRVERVGAWPSAICRPLGFGDASIRGQWKMRRRVAELVHREKVDLIFATVLPAYTSLVGAWAKRRLHLPFVLDYQDPWVSDLSAKHSLLSKAGLSQWLALRLEPKVVRLADALTAVSYQTLNSLRQRGLIAPDKPVEIVPIGADEHDHEVAAHVGKSRIEQGAGGREQGVFNLAYVGTLTERMLPALRALLCVMRAAARAMAKTQLRLHLIGTSAQPDGKDKLGVAAMAREIGVGDMVKHEPRRVPYLDALRTMQDADCLLLLGSTDSHYTASKLFPCWLAKRPILGVFHSASTVSQLAGELGGVELVTYNDSEGPETRVSQVATALRRLLIQGSAAVPTRNEIAFEPYSARGIARTYARLFDRVVGASGKS